MSLNDTVKSWNPCEPQPCERWTLAGLYDLPEELLVAAEFWDFLGGKGAYEELLNVFELVGIELRTEIEARFAKVKEKKLRNNR